MGILKLLYGACERIDVLEHPFYERWNAGELAPEELAFYAGEYRHAVVSLADAAALAAERAAQSRALEPELREGLRRHAEEEAQHVSLWDEFAAATGQQADRAPLRETEDCVEAWTAGESLLDHLAVLYAIESSQPAISKTKLDGLVAHYGFDRSSAGLHYFRLHSTLDVDHAREAGALIERLAEDRDSQRLLERAEDALRGNWRLLDGVEARRLAVTA